MISAEAIETVSAQFRAPWPRAYVKGKLKGDPIYEIVRELLAGSTSPLLDLGCGIGLLPLYLHASGDRRAVTGVDHDARKTDLAESAVRATGTTAQFIRGDIRRPVEFQGNVVLLDVLHYFSADDQRAILRSAARSTAQGSLLILRDCLKEPTLRYYATVIQERFSKTIGWLRGERLNFPTRQFIVDTLSEAGLTLVEVRSLWFRTPFNNYLLLFRR